MTTDRFIGHATEYRYSDTSSYKQWTIITIDDHDTGLTFSVTTWGKVGAAPQGKFLPGPNGNNEASRKANEKVRKGYEYYDRSELSVTQLSDLGHWIPMRTMPFVKDYLTANGTPQEVVALPVVDIKAEAADLVQQTISLAHSDPGQAAVKLGNLRTTVAALRAQLESAEAGAEVAEAVVRKQLEA